MQLNSEMLPYVLYQLDTAKNDLEGAKYLIDGKMYRISLNRSYYCVFHTMKALATMHNQNFSKHSGYISFFNREFVKSGIFSKELGRIVTDLKSMRDRGDYGDMIEVSREDAVNDYNAASVFYEQVSQYIRNEIGNDLI